MKLLGTPLSHFTRKPRILLAEFGVDFDFVRTTSVLAPTPDAYGDNPLLRVPALVDGEVTLYESNHIARYVVGKVDPADRFGVCTTRPRDLNRLAVANGIMANEVVLILARRGGLEDLESVAYFRKLRTAIDSGLQWLDAHVDLAGPFDYAEMTLVAMWQHVVHYQLVATDRYGRIAARVAALADRPSVASTSPAVSLADAQAAGWRPTTT